MFYDYGWSEATRLDSDRADFRPYDAHRPMQVS
jgi:hypothetical protein